MAPFSPLARTVISTCVKNLLDTYAVPDTEPVQFVKPAGLVQSAIGPR
eukprot:g5674.t1